MDCWSVLAGLRFWLALIVAVNHLAGDVDVGRLGWVARFGSFEAILGFLLISGYSIAESYKARPEGYLARRAARVYPVYLAAIAMTYAVIPVPLTAEFIATIAANALFLNQAVTTSTYVGVAWSLSLEVWLYLLAPWLACRSPQVLQRLIALSMLAYVVHVCGRSLFHWPYYNRVGFGLNLLLLSFAWLAGWLVSVLPQRGRALALVAGVFALHIGLTTAIQSVYRYKHAAMAELPADLLNHAMQSATLLLVWLVIRHAAGAGARPAALSSPWLRWLGDLSYPLYLLHIPTFIALKNAGVDNAYAMLAAALLLSAVAHHGLESRGWLRSLRRWPGFAWPWRAGARNP